MQTHGLTWRALRREWSTLKADIQPIDCAIYHEIFHYAAARLLGVQARINGPVTIVANCALWKSLVITLAPVIPAILFGWMAWSDWLASERDLFHQILLASNTVIVSLYLLTCGADFHSAACEVLGLPHPYPYVARRRRRRRAT